MSELASCLYQGEVVHRRMTPLHHELRYRVVNLFADIDELPQLGRRLKLFSYNAFNLFSIDDHGHGRGDGTPLRDHVWTFARQVETRAPITRIFMFCYPRLLGMVFNPITVYYCLDRQDQLQATLYEVNNTFGERHTYALAYDGPSGQACDKLFYVSPFNDVSGRYEFRAEAPGGKLKLAITLMRDEKPCLSAWFSGSRLELSDGALLRAALAVPVQPLKVYGGIHLEAARLWLKGLALQQRPEPPSAPVSIHPSDASTHERSTT